MEEGGFEPPKSMTADLQSAPFGRSGTPPRGNALYCGAREGLLSKDIMNQVSYLIIRARNFDNRLLKLAKYMYAKDEGDDALQAVCVQLMKGGKTSHEDFRFYSKAVEKNFPLTRLYESYMLSMDLRREEPIPKRVLMYFSYQSDLPVAQNAYIYAYVVKNREENPEVYETFQDTISRFLVKQLYAGRVDANLAYLYQKILLEEMFTEDNIKQFAKIQHPNGQFHLQFRNQNRL